MDPLSFLRKIAGAGVGFCAGDLYGHYMDLTPEDAVALSENPDAFWASKHRLSLETYRQWKAFLETGCACTGTTRVGRPCKQTVSVLPGPPAPHSQFIVGVNDRCEHHQVTKRRQQQ